MANSRKLNSKPPSLRRSKAIQPLIPKGKGVVIGIALSGGLDSIVLFDAVMRSLCTAKLSSKCSETKSEKPIVWVFHVHHGLQKSADAWLDFCARAAQNKGANFDFRLLQLPANTNEAEARLARYEALADLCEMHGVSDLLLAHHQNDQAETVLLQLLRGAGISGLAGMPSARTLKHAGTKPITLWRPLLDLSRKELEAYALEQRLTWVEDPSNRSLVYRRNAVRHALLPKLELLQPGAIANLARSAKLLSESHHLLERLAKQDSNDILQIAQIAAAVTADIASNQIVLKIKPLLVLYKSDHAAANNVIRYWLRQLGLAMPTLERLQSWWLDLNRARSDARLEFVHDGGLIRLWRGQLLFETSAPPKQTYDASAGKWVFLPLPLRSKRLGLAAQWVQQAKQQDAIEFRPRKGGERFKKTMGGVSKTLKNLFQESAIPPWQRRAPLLYIHGEVVAVAGLGVSHTNLVATGKRVWPEWQALTL